MNACTNYFPFSLLALTCHSSFCSTTTTTTTTTTTARYVVLDVEPVVDAKGTEIESGVGSGKYLLADLTLARAKDFGVNDDQFIVRSHLGRILQPGDMAWGFDMATSQFNDECVLMRAAPPVSRHPLSSSRLRQCRLPWQQHECMDRF